MKKLIWTLSLMIVLALFTVWGIGGCALFQKPPTDPDAKKAWIQDTRNALDNADLGVDAVYILFNGFCTAGRIDQKTCALGPVAVQEWKNNYGVAKDAVNQYESGAISQPDAQKLIDRTMIKSLAAVMASLAPAKSLVKERALKLKGDLGVPAGQTKGPKK